ncbi:MAG: sugar transferase [Limisphaerales bacterium]
MSNQNCLFVGEIGRESHAECAEHRGARTGGAGGDSIQRYSNVPGEPSHDGHLVPIPGWKRIFDTLLILLLLPLLLPVALGIAVLIKLVSSGPVIFSQSRVGHQGREFTCLKFRTMDAGAGSTPHQEHLVAVMTSGGPLTKLDAHGDDRIIPGGKLLRWSGLDELPQLVNVLRGEMSIVGPRPCLPYEFAHYEARHKGRLAALPGLTGLWQVSGKNRTTFEQMIDLDLAYIARQTPVRDLGILIRTVGVVTNGLFAAVSGPETGAVPTDQSSHWLDADRTPSRPQSVLAP